MKHYIRVLQQWFFRGLFYAFIGILTSFFSSTASSSNVLPHAVRLLSIELTLRTGGSNRPTWTNVVSLLLVLMGALYSIMVILIRLISSIDIRSNLSFYLQGLLCVKSRLAKSHAYSEIVETVGSGEEV